MGVINGNSEDIILEAAVQVCHTMMCDTTLAPLIVHSSKTLSLTLTESLARWLIAGHRSDLDIRLTKMMVGEVCIHLRNQLDRGSAMTAIVDHILVPSARLLVALENDEREIVQQFMKEMKELITSYLFNGKLHAVYVSSLTALYSEEAKQELPKCVKSLLLSLISAAENEPVEITRCLVSELLYNFSVLFKNQYRNYLKIVILVCHLLGLPVPNTTISSALENSHTAQELKPLCLQKEKQEVLLYSILKCVDSVWLDLAVELDGLTLAEWFKMLGQKLITTSLVSQHGYKCLHILLAANPQDTSALILKNLWSIYCSDANTGLDADDAVYSAYDELLCELLEVCLKLHKLPQMLDSILSGLNGDSVNLENHLIIPASLLVFEGKMLLPPR